MFIQGHKRSSTLGLWGHSYNPSAAEGLGPPVAQLVECSVHMLIHVWT